MLVRAEMERVTEELPGLYDLVPAAVALGRRRRARVRGAVAASVAAVAALGWFAVPAVLEGDGAGVPTVAGSPSPSPSVAVPDAEYLAMTPAERERLASFQVAASGVLNTGLPDAVGEVAPVEGSVDRYTGRLGHRAFPVTFSVRPAGEAYVARVCDGALAKGVECERVTLPGRIEASVVTAPTFRGAATRDLTAVTLVFPYRDSLVTLAVRPDAAAGVSAPVTVQQMRYAASDPEFLELVRAADRKPLLKAAKG